jgi:hypothetical protein
MNAENSNQLKHSWDREYSKLSEAGQNFVAVAQRDASSGAQKNLLYPGLADEVQFLIQIARSRDRLTDTDREALRELSWIAARISQTVDYDAVRRFDWPHYYAALGGTLRIAEQPGWDIGGELRWIEAECRGEEWASAMASLDPVDAEFAQRMVEDKKQGGEGTIS